MGRRDKVTLNISLTLQHGPEGGAGIVGSDGYKTYNHTDDDFSNKPFLHVRRYIYVHPHDT